MRPLLNYSSSASNLEGLESYILLPSLPKSVASSRVYGAALLQSTLLRRFGSKVELIVGEHEVSSLDTASGAREIFSNFGDPNLEPLEKILSERSGESITLWLTPQSFEQKVFRAFYSRFVSGRSNINFKCPSSNWLFGYPDEFLDIENLSDSEVFSLLMLLTGEIPSKDLDLNAARYEEKENLLWLSTSLLSRLKQANTSDLGPYLERDALDRFPLLFVDGARRGEVARLVGEYRKFLFSVISWLGAPPRDKQSRNLTDQDIISGIVNVVSDMISLHG